MFKKGRGGRKGGRDGGSDRLLSIEEEEGQNWDSIMEEDAAVTEDLEDRLKKSWKDGERFCLKADFCKMMGPEDDYNQKG